MTKKEFYKTFINIGLPIALSQLIMASLHFVDILMIGTIGEAAIAAVGAAGRIFFIFIVSVFGIYSAGGIFTSQYWGAKNLKALHQIMGIMMIFGLSLAIIMALLVLLLPYQIMRLFSADPVVINYGMQYLRIVAPSFILSAITFLYAYVSRSIHMTKYPLYISIISVSLNTFLNYVLINGHFGLPRLEVRGAAIATLTARAVEFVIFLALVAILKNHPLRASLSEMFSFNKSQLVNFVKKGIAVFLNEASWVVGQSVFFIAYGLLGTEALSSVQISLTFSDIFVSLFTGISTACSVMVGNALGANQIELAKKLAKRFVKICNIAALIVSFILGGLALIIPLVYTHISAETVRLAQWTLVVIAFYQIPKMYSYIATIGILRSGGDTLFGMIIDLVGVWGIGIPLAFLAAGVWHLPIYWVVACAFSEEIIKDGLYVWRVRSGIWAQNLVA